MKPYIPQRELAALSQAMALALAMAESGYEEVGYVRLLEGRHRARQLRDEGEPWGDDLLACYSRTLNDFAEQFDVARE
jgi:hypothetical protein